MTTVADANLYRFLADAVVVFHFAFVGFVLFGGLLVLRWRRLAWAHLPCVAWGIYIELSHGLCPLTPLENDLRLRGDPDGTYAGGFVDHYIMPVLYPSGLTPRLQVAIAGVIVAINAACYGTLAYRAARRRRSLPAVRAAEAVAPATPATPDVELSVAAVGADDDTSGNVLPPAARAG